MVGRRGKTSVTAPEAGRVVADDRGTATERSLRWFWLFVALMLAAQAALAVDVARRWTPTHDEYWHLPMGLVYWQTGDWRVDPINPPLVRLWANAPLWLGGVKLELPPEILGHVAIPSPEQVGDAFFFESGEEYRQRFFMCRLMMIPLASLGGLILAGWARNWYGDRAGLLATGLWACCPTVLANSAIVTHDMAGTVGVLASTWACLWWKNRPTWTRAIVFGVILGAAQLTKLTAILVLPICGLAWVLLPADDSGKVGGGAEAKPIAWRVVVLQGLAVLIAAWGVLCLQYGSVGLLPAPYLAAWARLRQDLGTQHPVFLNGEWRSTGYPQYYLWVLADKLPLGTLVVLGLAMWLVAREWRARWRRSLFLAGAFLVFFIPASLSGNQLGIRYILPAYPFLILLASQAAGWWSRPAFRLVDSRWGKLVLGAAVITLPLALRHHPNHLGYFNLLAGGPVGGIGRLADSNIDWGQNLYNLRDHVREKQIEKLKLVYFGSLLPGEVGLPYETPPSFTPELGWHAVSINFVQGRPHSLKLPEGEHRQVGLDEFGYFRFFEPVARIGDSILLYHLSQEDVDRFLKLREELRAGGELLVR